VKKVNQADPALFAQHLLQQEEKKAA